MGGWGWGSSVQILSFSHLFFLPRHPQPPGCGKTLSFMLAQANLRGSSAASPVFRFLRHLRSETFQCSEQTEAPEVIAAYSRAVARQRSYDSSDPGHFAVALSLDEVGLPKERRQAIKGLHDPLEQVRLGAMRGMRGNGSPTRRPFLLYPTLLLHLQRIVGAIFMSNTTLDAAKTSRMMQVLQSQANEHDLKALARGLLFGGVDARPAQSPYRGDASLAARVDGLCTAYLKLSDPATRDGLLRGETWFESRDFLYLCRRLAYSVETARNRAPGDFDASMLLSALRHNFQCQDSRVFPALARHFLAHTRLQLPAGLELLPQPVATLREALADVVTDRASASTHFRHILLIDHSQGELSLDVLRALRAEDEELRLAGGGSAAGFKLGDDSRMRIIAMSKFADDLTPTKQAECLGT